MKATIVECVVGVLGFDEGNELVSFVLFPKNPKETAERLERMEAGEVVDEIVSLVTDLKNRGYRDFEFENSRIAKNASKILQINVDVVLPSEPGKLVRGNLEKYAVDVGFVEQADEIHDWVHKVSMELTKSRVTKAAEKRDLVLVQAIQTVNDLDKILNLSVNRLREWYSLHFPEMDRLIENHEAYIDLVAKLGKRENFSYQNLKEAGLSTSKARATSKAAQMSMGAQFEDEDIVQIQTICVNIISLYKARRSLESFVESTIENVAPNLRALAGSLLGSRLIAQAGGLTNLAKMPASTVQVLGAEKALFRALKRGSRPPKHGLIFQHPSLHEAPRKHRGKIARALAGKLVIAARIDAFSTKLAGDQLQRDLQRRIEEILEKP